MRIITISCALMIIMVLCGLTGCDGTSGSLDYGPLLVQIAVSSTAGNIFSTTVCHVEFAGNPIDDATVQVNGITINSIGSGDYQNAFMGLINAGEEVLIAVSKDAYSVSHTFTMPARAGITAPLAADGPFDASQPLNITWNAVTPTPNQIITLVTGTHTADSSDWFNTIAGTRVSDIIPADTLKTGTSGILIYLEAANAASYLGSHSAVGSWAMVANIAKSEALQTQ